VTAPCYGKEGIKEDEFSLEIRRLGHVSFLIGLNVEMKRSD
jgi:hypothetical protein